MGKRPRQDYPPVRDLTSDERVGLVREVFATIPRHYDLLNRVFSLRRDVAWRRFAVRRMRFCGTDRLLDIATGTADLALAAAREHPQIRVAALDFAREMMHVGAAKCRRLGLQDRVRFVQGDAMRLPFPDHAFDAASCAFGIRNMPDRAGALREMARVVRPGGQVLILEMHFPRHPLLQPVYNLYLNHLLPRAARWFSPNPAAYRYLGDSILDFPPPAAFADLMSEAGLVRITHHSLTFGICCLYLGWNPNGPSGA